MNSEIREEALKDFALAPAPKGAEPLLGNIQPYDSNLDLIVGFKFEVDRLIQDGDPQLKNVSLPVAYSTSVYRAQRYLQGLLSGRMDKGVDESDLGDLLDTIEKVTDVYYRPKIKFLRSQIYKSKQEHDRLTARFEFLLGAAIKDPRAIDRLGEEFYPDGTWDPETEDIIPECGVEGLVSLQRYVQQASFRERFADAFRSPMAQNPVFSVRTMFGQPECLLIPLSVLKDTLYALQRNEKALAAMTGVCNDLRKIIYPQNAAVVSLEKARLIKGLSL